MKNFGKQLGLKFDIDSMDLAHFTKRRRKRHVAQDVDEKDK